MKIYTFVRHIVGATAQWMIRQHRGNGVTPRGFNEVLKSLHEKLLTSETFKNNQTIKNEDMFFLADEVHLQKFLTTQLMSIPEFLELNLREVEWNIGLRARDVENDERRLEKLKAARVPMGIHRYHQIKTASGYNTGNLKKEYEFIGLGALVRNICMSIIAEQEEFNKKEGICSQKVS